MPHKVGLQTRVDSNHGVTRLLQCEDGPRSKSLTNAVVIRETKYLGEKSEIGRAVSPRLGSKRGAVDSSTQGLLHAE